MPIETSSFVHRMSRSTLKYLAVRLRTLAHCRRPSSRRAFSDNHSCRRGSAASSSATSTVMTLIRSITLVTIRLLADAPEVSVKMTPLRARLTLAEMHASQPSKPRTTQRATLRAISSTRRGSEPSARMCPLVISEPSPWTLAHAERPSSRASWEDIWRES
jgi:hypothetical protein